MNLLSLVVAMLIGAGAFSLGSGNFQASTSLTNFAVVVLLIQIYIKMKKR